MRCRKPFVEADLSGWAHRLWCTACRRNSQVDEEISAGVARMRAVPVPALPDGLLARLQAPSFSTTAKGAARPLWLGATLAICTVAFSLLGLGIYRAKIAASGPAAGSGLAWAPLVPTDPLGGFRSEPSSDLASGPKSAGSPLRRGQPKFVTASRSEQPAAVPERPATQSDDAYLNPGRCGVAVEFVQRRGVKRAAPLPPMRDDFAVPEPILFAMNADAETLRQMTDEQKRLYAQAAEVVDGRLVHNVALALKHASFDEVCKELKRQTGVEIRAGRNVADDNATLFITSRPAREVMREISRVFGFIWERAGREGSYTYVLRQETASQIAEEKVRNDDVSKSIEGLSTKMRSADQSGAEIDTSSGTMRIDNGQTSAAQTVFNNLSLAELDILRSGRQLRLGPGNVVGQTDGPLDPEIQRQILHAAGGVRLEGTFWMSYGGDDKAPGVIPFEKLEGACAGVSLLLKVLEFGGASLGAEIWTHAKNPDGSNAGYAHPMALATVPGPAETAPENAQKNKALKSAEGLNESVDIRPKPTTPIGEQGVDPEPMRSGSITDFQGSYRTHSKLQPPRPFMTSDDFWEAVHEKTKKDIVADSYSRLYLLRNYKGSLFSVLSQACDAMLYRWGLSEGFLTGRSATFHWQRLSEVPKRNLTAWQDYRKKNKWLPLRAVLAMSLMTDRQLDSFEVGKTIAHQWRLPEWGIPSRPHLSGPRDYVRPICRFLANLPTELLARAEQGTLLAGDIPPAMMQILQYKDMPPDTTLRVDYIPPGQYYWSPFFEQGKDQVLDDLIFAATKEAVLAEVRRRYPDCGQDGTSFSDGLMGLLMHNDHNPGWISPSYDMGDQRFFVGHRLVR